MRVPSAGPAGEAPPVEDEEVVVERRADDAVSREGDRADERCRRSPPLEDVEDLVEESVVHERLASDRRRPSPLIRAARTLASSRVVPGGSAAR